MNKKRFISSSLLALLLVGLVAMYHFIPNTTIKQAAIVDNLDRNYCKDIDAIVLKK
jgi:hypothetical protein